MVAYLEDADKSGTIGYYRAREDANLEIGVPDADKSGTIGYYRRSEWAPSRPWRNRRFGQNAEIRARNKGLNR